MADEWTIEALERLRREMDAGYWPITPGQPSRAETLARIDELLAERAEPRPE